MPLPTKGKKETRSEFMSRCMSNETMKSEFPDEDQRAAVCAKQARTSKSVDVFAIVHRAMCVCMKQDIPEVESVVRLIQPQIEGFWRGVAAEVEDRAEEMLLAHNLGAGDEEDDDRFIEDLILLLLLLVFERTRRELPRVLATSIDRAARRLSIDGAASVQLPPATRTSIELLRSEAKADLMNLLRGRFTTRQPEIRRILARWLSSGPLRSLRAPLVDVETRALPGSLQRWRDDLATALGADTRRWIGPVVDLWAYRWWNMNIFLAGREAGVLAWEAYAVLDTRTTPFCRRFIGTGRIVAVERLERQFNAVRDAARSDDPEAAITAWPLLGADEIEDESAWARFWDSPSVGFPPYHWRCRTRIRPVRVE